MVSHALEALYDCLLRYFIVRVVILELLYDFFVFFRDEFSIGESVRYHIFT